MSEASQALAQELGGEVPEGFTALTEAQLGWLIDTLKKAKAYQLSELDKSTEATVNGLPLMLRGPVRAIIGGKK